MIHYKSRIKDYTYKFDDPSSLNQNALDSVFSEIKKTAPKEKFNDVIIHYGHKAEILGVDVTGLLKKDFKNDPIDPINPIGSVFSASAFDISKHADNIDVREEFGFKDGNFLFDDFSDIDKLRAKQIHLLAKRVSDVKFLDLSDDVLVPYLKASGKTIDKLNDIDHLCISIAHKIGNKSDDISKLIETLNRYDGVANAIKIGKTTLKVVNNLGNVLTIVRAGMHIYEACTAIREGNYDKGAKILTAGALEFGIENIGGAVITQALAPYLMGIGGVVGGPLGIALGGILAGAIGYGIAGFVGSKLYDKIMEDFGESERIRLYDPLVLDMLGDGLNPAEVKHGAHFDLDQNGFAEKMSWIRGDDHLLAIDKNGDGQINNGNEVFGDKTRLKNGQFARNGFEALKEYDTDKNGMIDEKDADFSSLLLWKDVDGNGISDKEELISLKDSEVVSIKLDYERLGESTESGVVIGNVAKFYKSDGSEYRIAEYWVQNETYNTKDLETIEISQDVLGLANVKERGIVPSIHKAIMLDKTGNLKNMWIQFGQSKNIEERIALIEQILYISTGAEKIVDGSRGLNFDAKKLHIMESLLGRKFQSISGENPNRNAVWRLEQTYKQLISAYYSEASAETTLKNIIPLIGFTEDNGKKSVEFSALKIFLPELLEENAELILGDLGRYFEHLRENGISGFDEFISHFGSLSEEYNQWIAVGAELAIKGSNENDTLSTTKEKPYAFGKAGDDKLNGSSDNDKLYGGEGDDTINAASGDDIIDGGTGDDVLMSGFGDDIIDGGTGNDTLDGSHGVDTYVFGKGYGVDTIDEKISRYYSQTQNIVRFKDITEEEIEVVRLNAYDVELRVKNTEDKLIIRNYASSYYGIKEVIFSDETKWDISKLSEKARMLRGTEGDDTISAFSYENYEIYGNAGNDKLTGSSLADKIYGGEGDDTINAASGDDIIDGGEGKDILDGLYGNDTYIFGKGYGVDEIKSSYGDSNDKDVVKFKDITEEEIEVVRLNAYDVELQVKNSNDKLIIRNYQYSNLGIDEIQFSDGKVWNLEKLVEKARILKGTDGNDTITAFNHESYEIYGNAGDDNIKGNSGNDIIYGGEGNDTIQAEYGNDIIDGGTGDDNIMTYFGDDTLDGGIGNDILDGGHGVDTYVFGKGYGVDTIDEKIPSYYSNTQNILKLKDITEDEIEVVRLNAYDVELRVKNSEDKLIIKNYASSYYGIKEVIFSDETKWDISKLSEKARMLRGTESDDTISAFNSENYEIHGKAGNDKLTGSSLADKIYGGEGDDTINAASGDDIIDGGEGKDILDGLYGNDTYIFGKGYGVDEIKSSYGDSNDKDVVKFKDITEDEVEVVRLNAYDVELQVKNSNDKLIIRNYQHSNLGIDEIQFSDGKVWNLEKLVEKARILKGTDESDTITAFNGESYTIYGNAGNDKLTGSSLADKIYGGEGDDTINAGSGDDIIDGGLGDDIIHTSYGNETYIFGKGYGADEIKSGSGYESDKDIVKLKDITEEEIEVVRLNADDVELRVKNTDDKLIIRNYRSPYFGLDEIQFSDGKVWNLEKLSEKARILRGTDGDDTILAFNSESYQIYAGAGADKIYTSNGDDIIDGGLGDDIIHTSYGNETYIFGKGYGADEIKSGSGYESDKDIVKLKDITEDEIEVVRLNADDVELRVKNTDDKLIIRNYRSSYFGIDEIQFSDGKVWNLEKLVEKARILRGTDESDTITAFNGESYTIYGNVGDDNIKGNSGNDDIFGGEGNDTIKAGSGDDIISGGEGNDTLTGNSGNDTYIFEENFGNDVITNAGSSSDKDIIDMRVNALNLIFEQHGRDLLISKYDSADTITVKDWGYGGSYQVDEIKTADNRKLTSDRVQQLIQAMAGFTKDTGMTYRDAMRDKKEEVSAIYSQFWTAE